MAVVQKRGMRPSILSSLKETSTSHIRDIFNNIEASPKVNIVIGVAIKLKIGFKKEFIIPITIPIKRIICHVELKSIPNSPEYPGIIFISTPEIKEADSQMPKAPAII
jgi:hypothetical protein